MSRSTWFTVPLLLLLAVPAAAEPLTTTVRRDLDELASRRTLLILGAGGALAGVCTLFEDPDRAASALEKNPWDGMADVGNAWPTVASIGAGAAWLTGYVAHQPTLERTGSELARSLIYSGIVVNVLKVTVNRTRPNGDSYSFPSGHAAAAFSVAPVLAARFGKVAAVPAYALGVMTAMGRLEEHKHFLSDVVFGATVGLASGFAVTASDANAQRMSVIVEPQHVGFVVSF